MPFSILAITSVATQLPTKLLAARTIPTNQSTDKISTNPTAGMAGKLDSVAASTTMAEAGIPWAPFEVNTAITSKMAKSCSDKFTPVACAINYTASVR